MLKRLVVLLAVPAALAIPAFGAFAAPAHHTTTAVHDTNGLLPEQACFAIYPEQTQPLLCGKGNGGPTHAGG